MFVSSLIFTLRRKGNEQYKMDWYGFFREYFINSFIWKSNKKELNDYEGMTILFHLQLNIIEKGKILFWSINFIKSLFFILKL